MVWFLFVQIAIVFEDTKLRSVLHSGIPLADALQAALQTAPTGPPAGPPPPMATQTQPPPAHLVSSAYSQPPPPAPGATYVPPATLDTGVQQVFSSSVLGAIPAPSVLPSAAGRPGTSGPPHPLPPAPALLTNRPPPGFPAAPPLPHPTQTNVPPPTRAAAVPVARPLYPPPPMPPFAHAAPMPNVNVPPPNFAPPVFQAPPAPEYEPTTPANIAIPNVPCPYPEVSRAANTPRGRGQRGGRGGRSRPLGGSPSIFFRDVLFLYYLTMLNTLCCTSTL